MALDVRRETEEVMPPGALLKLCEPIDIDEDETASARRGFQRRLRDTRGVVTSAGENIGTAIYIDAVRASDDPDYSPRKITVPTSVRDALTHLHNYWEVGDEEMEDPMALARAARQLSFGFYYRWDWTFTGRVPNGVADKEWLALRRLWHRAIRTFLQSRSRPGCDSPLLVTNAARRGELDRDTTAAWVAWDDVSNREVLRRTYWGVGSMILSSGTFTNGRRRAYSQRRTRNYLV